MTTAPCGTGPLTVTQPVPPVLALPAGYDRHAPEIPEQRAALGRLVAGWDWPARSWSELIEDLLALGRTDIPLSRLAEGHVDALRIIAQAGAEATPGALYGVWASRSQQTGIRASQPATGDGLRLDGTLRFASGAGLLDRALVPVWLDDGALCSWTCRSTGCRWTPASGAPWRWRPAARTSCQLDGVLMDAGLRSARRTSI